MKTWIWIALAVGAILLIRKRSAPVGQPGLTNPCPPGMHPEIYMGLVDCRQNQEKI